MGANPSRERAHLNAEAMDRAAYERSLMNGDAQSAAMYANRADWNAYQADKVHYNRYAKGRTFAPYALHAGRPSYGGYAGAGSTFTPPAALPGTWGTVPTTQAPWMYSGGVGAVTPGYTAPTIAGAYGTIFNTMAVETQVPVGATPVDMCIPVPAAAAAPVGVAAPTIGAMMPAMTAGSAYW